MLATAYGPQPASTLLLPVGMSIMIARHWSAPAGCSPGYEEGCRSACLLGAAKRRRGLSLARLGVLAPVTGMCLMDDYAVVKVQKDYVLH